MESVAAARTRLHFQSFVKYKFRFAPKFAKHLQSASTSNFNGSGFSHILYQLLELLNGDLKAKPPAAGGKGVWGQRAILVIYYQNNPFLCMFQLKFYLKPSKLVH